MGERGSGLLIPCFDDRYVRINITEKKRKDLFFSGQGERFGEREWIQKVNRHSRSFFHVVSIRRNYDESIRQPHGGKDGMLGSGEGVNLVSAFVNR